MKIERTTGLTFIYILASVVRSDGRRSKAYITRGKRQNAFNTNLSSGQQQPQYASSSYPASFGSYQRTGSNKPDSSLQLARERGSNFQELEMDAKNPASMTFNDSWSGAQRPQLNVNVISGSSLKNEKSANGFQSRIVRGTITDSYGLQRYSIECRKTLDKRNRSSQS